MGSTSIRSLFIAFFFFFALSSISFAQDAEVQAEKEESGGSIKDLGRRGMIVAKNLQNGVLDDPVGTALGFDSGLGIVDAFFASFSMIIVSEIGDETFIIAALMAMRHPKSTVLSGALAALFVMTVLSTGLGRIVPNLISRKHTNSAATVLYAFFGLRLLYIAWRSDTKGSQKKEMEEVEEKLETGQGKTYYRRFLSRFCTPIFLESFILTFLAEWGDRSQIATIALATHKNAVGVAVGAMIGHTICTSLAVVGGSMLAAKISQRSVATVPRYNLRFITYKDLPFNGEIQGKAIPRDTIFTAWRLTFCLVNKGYRMSFARCSRSPRQSCNRSRQASDVKVEIALHTAVSEAMTLLMTTVRKKQTPEDRMFFEKG
ncbi:hypothetical protein V6N13_147403 [Hibiscus sabdariffa]|uniref:GDT1 family protein n=1 Tax=Hibiscus sabdariffa TaxID=183260 RepID=A0ABR2TW86_9ROSI